MMRIPIWSLAAAALMLASACSKSTQKSAERAQIEADQRRMEAQQQQPDPNAAANAATEAQHAQHRADEERAAAERDFASEKAEYSANIQRDVDRNKARLDDLEGARAKAKGVAREAQDRAVARVNDARRVLDDDMRAIQNATQSEWPGLKAKVTRDLDVYRTAVSDAEGARSKTEPSGRRMTAPNDGSRPMGAAMGGDAGAHSGVAGGRDGGMGAGR